MIAMIEALINMQAKRRWNFDFENEVPLPGRYEWVKIDLDGNEISDFAQSTTGERDLQEERPSETGKANAEDE